jgi:glycosyltransferase involved in cell wall biosynthesis
MDRGNELKEPPQTSKQRLLFLITEDWYFWSHRLELARAAQRAGWEVLVATRVQDHAKRIEDEGFRLLPLRLSRSSWHPLQEILAVLELIRLYRGERPDLVHHVALKPILYGSFAARVTNVKAVVNAFPGLGYTFIGDGKQKGVLRSIIGKALQWVLGLSNSRAVFQNEADAAELVKAGVVSWEEISIIRGVGVNTKIFAPPTRKTEGSLVVLAGRLLWDKGIEEFVKAARLLKANGIESRFVLVGMVDRHNPAAIPEAQLRTWEAEGAIEWWGHREDMPSILGSADIVVLPSYREGLPKVLLEAAACARPVVATDVPGCREIVKDGINGLLVPPKDSASLSHAIAKLLKDPGLRAQMGACGREIVLKEFSVDRISRQTLELYRELMAKTQAPRTLPSYP